MSHGWPLFSFKIKSLADPLPCGLITDNMQKGEKKKKEKKLDKRVFPMNWDEGQNR